MDVPAPSPTGLGDDPPPPSPRPVVKVKIVNNKGHVIPTTTTVAHRLDSLESQVLKLTTAVRELTEAPASSPTPTSDSLVLEQLALLSASIENLNSNFVELKKDSEKVRVLIDGMEKERRSSITFSPAASRLITGNRYAEKLEQEGTSGSIIRRDGVVKWDQAMRQADSAPVTPEARRKRGSSFTWKSSVGEERTMEFLDDGWMVSRAASSYERRRRKRTTSEAKSVSISTSEDDTRVVGDVVDQRPSTMSNDGARDVSTTTTTTNNDGKKKKKHRKKKERESKEEAKKIITRKSSDMISRPPSDVRRKRKKKKKKKKKKRERERRRSTRTDHASPFSDRARPSKEYDQERKNVVLDGTKPSSARPAKQSSRSKLGRGRKKKSKEITISTGRLYATETEETSSSVDPWD